MNVYPVVHIKDESQGREQANLALSLGADGVFFICHGGDDTVTEKLTIEFSKAFPDRVIGANFLSMRPGDATKLAASVGIKNLWLDNAGIHSQFCNKELVRHIHNTASRGKVQVFAGVAFKYQTAEPDPVKAVEIALSAGFIPTTSGSATGYSPEVDKIKLMAGVANDSLGVASGLTEYNQDEFMPYVKHAFVATGVSIDEYHFDAVKLKAFIDKSKEFKKSRLVD